MKKMLTLFTLLMLLSSTVLADYPTDRRVGMGLMNAGKYAEAQAFFSKLASGQTTELQKSDALEQATRCALRLNQFGEATEYTRQIPLKPIAIALQMNILLNQYQSAKVLAEFKDVDIASWPEQFRCEGYYARGQAAMAQKNGELAVSDLTHTFEYANDENVKGEACLMLGETYRSVIKDDAKAIEAFRMTYKTNNEYKQASAAISIAGILANQKKFDQALAELGRIKMEQMQSPHWLASVHMGYGSVYATQGNKQQALAKYTEALAVKDIPPHLKNTCEKAIAQLQSP